MDHRSSTESLLTAVGFAASVACALAYSPAPAAAAAAPGHSDGSPDGGVAPSYETVVTAPADDVSRPLEDEAASASVVTSRRTPKSAETLESLIAELPGVTVTRLGGLGSAAFVSLRGSSPDQVRVYLDGAPLNAASGGGVDLSTVALGDVDRIEVYRSMSPLGFGAAAMGGIVSITTRAPRETRGAAEIGGGSFGTRFVGAQGSWAGRLVRAFAGAHLASTDGDFEYRSDNGTAFDPTDDTVGRRENNALDQADGTVRVTAELPGRREVSLSALWLIRRQGLPGFGIYPTTQASLSLGRGLATLAYDSSDDLGPGGRVVATAYLLGIEQRFEDPLAEIAIAPARSRDRHGTAGVTARFSRPATRWLRLSALVAGQWEGFRPHDDLAATPDGAPASRLFGSGGLEADAWIPRLRLDVIPSVRAEASRDTRSGRSSFGDPLPTSEPIVNLLPVLRLAVIQRPSDAVAIKANVGRSSRLPSTTELYGNAGYLVGNPRLRPETSVSADVGTAARMGSSRRGATIEGAVFGALVDDLIQFQQDAYGRAHPKNIGRARIVGAELSVEGRPGAGVRIAGQGTVTDAVDTSNNSASRARRLPNRPRYRAHLRPEIRREVGGGRFELGAYTEVDATGGNYLDPANLVALPARVLLGAGAHAGWSGGQVRLVVSAHNLNDSRISDLAGFPLPGRSIFVSLTGTTSPNPNPSPNQLEERSQ